MYWNLWIINKHSLKNLYLIISKVFFPLKQNMNFREISFWIKTKDKKNFLKTKVEDLNSKKYLQVLANAYFKT